MTSHAYKILASSILEQEIKEFLFEMIVGLTKIKDWEMNIYCEYLTIYVMPISYISGL
jgi:hypothetical protein